MSAEPSNVVADIASHERVNNSLLAPLERPFLGWLARIVAPRASADACTLIGIGGAVVACAGYALSGQSPYFVGLATVGVLLHWLGDSLDGTVARLRGAGRPKYGFYVDHFADTLCQVLIFVGLGSSPYVSLPVACLSLAAFQAIAILVFLRTAVLGKFQLSFGRIGPTEGHALLLLQGIVILVVGPAHVNGVEWLSIYDLPVAAYGTLAAFHFVRVGLRDIRMLGAGNH